MNRNLNPKARLRQAVQLLSGLCLLGLLISGCAADGLAGHTIVARLNGTPINDERYYNNMEHLRAQDFPTTAEEEAGAVALTQVLRNQAVDDLAAQKGYAPSEDDVDSFYQYEMTVQPQLQAAVTQGLTSAEDQKRTIRRGLEQLAIGTDGATVDPQELQAAYTAVQSPQTSSQSTMPVTVDVPATVTIRALSVPDFTSGGQAISALKATGNWTAEAQQLHPARPFLGQQVSVPVDALQRQLPELYKAVIALKPADFAPEPVNVSPAGSPVSQYVVVQLISKSSPIHLSMDQVRVPLKIRVLQQKFPMWPIHMDTELYNFLQSANLEIYNDRYRDQVRAALLTPPQPAQQPGAEPAPGSVRPQGAPGAGAPPGSGRTTPGEGAQAPKADGANAPSAPKPSR